MNRRGFTLIELLVVISVISILASLLLPTITIIREKARIVETCNNLKRIVEGQVGYSSDYGTFAFPSGYDFTVFGAVNDPPTTTAQNNIFVGRVFVILAKVNQLPAKLFTNANATVRPTGDFAYYTCSYLDMCGIADGDATSPAMSDAEAMRWSYSFAYDWCAPQNAASGRPMIGDRDPSIWGGKGSCIGYPDGHSVFLSASDTNDVDVPETHTLFPLDVDGGVLAALDFNVSSAEFGVTDWVYTHDSQEKAAWGMGRASSTLAWLR